jgi:hypothetical protein
MRTFAIALFLSLAGCGDGEPPIIGMSCVEEIDCCDAFGDSECPVGLYCDNSGEPGQCLRICSDSGECSGLDLGNNNVCVPFDFGGRCMRRCTDDNDCSAGTHCEYYDNYPFKDLICYPN